MIVPVSRFRFIFLFLEMSTVLSVDRPRNLGFKFTSSATRALCMAFRILHVMPRFLYLRPIVRINVLCLYKNLTAMERQRINEADVIYITLIEKKIEGLLKMYLFGSDDGATSSDDGPLHELANWNKDDPRKITPPSKKSTTKSRKSRKKSQRSNKSKQSRKSRKSHKSVKPTKSPKLTKTDEHVPKTKPKAQLKTVRAILEKYVSRKRTSKVDLNRISKNWAGGEEQHLDEMTQHMNAHTFLALIPELCITEDIFNNTIVTREQSNSVIEKASSIFKKNPRGIIHRYISNLSLKNDQAIINTSSCFFMAFSTCNVMCRGQPMPLMYAYLQSQKCDECEMCNLDCTDCLFSHEIKVTKEVFVDKIVQRFVSSLPFAPHDRSIKTIIRSMLV